MQVKSKVIDFEWDKWNLDKNYLKHGVTPKEAEEAFVSEESYYFSDIKHSVEEERFILLGKTLEKKNLFIAFTLRGKKVRIISARRMHREEVEKYAKAKKNTKI
ncbi:MAG: BrnT family toxin [Patescibacteria group bacterium]|mgnify:FL=1